MRRMSVILLVVVLALAAGATFANAADDMAKKLSDVLSQGPANKFWQVGPDEVAGMISAKKTDFMIVDVRPNPAEFSQGHMPGAIQISVQDILKPENLKKLAKDKKIILVCVTGQTQNLPVIALRALGYNALTMKFGYASWIKDYHGAKLMQEAIHGAAAKSYPVVK